MDKTAAIQKSKFISLQIDKEFITISLITLFLLLILILFSDLMFYEHPLFSKEGWDHHHYISMAKTEPFSYRIAPFCWRILLPLIAYILPFEITYTFLTVSFLSLWIISIIIYYLIKKLNLSMNYAWIGVFLFLSTVWATRFSLIEFWYLDPLAYLFIVLSIYFIFTKNKIGYLISLAIGCMVRENVLFTIPLYYTINSGSNFFKNINFKAIKECIIFSTPAILISLILRILINCDNDYNFFTLLKRMILLRYDTLIGVESTLSFNLFNGQNNVLTSMINIYRYSFGAFGALALLPLLSIKKIKNYFLIFVPLFILSYIQLMFATGIERLLIINFLPLIILSLLSIKHFIDKFNLSLLSFKILSMLLFFVQLLVSKNYYQQTYYSVLSQILITIIFLTVIIFKVINNKTYKIIT